MCVNVCVNQILFRAIINSTFPGPHSDQIFLYRMLASPLNAFTTKALQ